MKANYILVYMGISYIILGTSYKYVNVHPSLMLGLVISSFCIVLYDLVVGNDPVKTFEGKKQYQVNLIQLILLIAILSIILVPNLNLVRSFDPAELSIISDMLTLITFGFTLISISSSDLAFLKKYLQKVAPEEEISEQSFEELKKENEELKKEVLILKQYQKQNNASNL
ncbi:hypothetical protein [Brevibacillus laterosporus]|uniref:hypothetical protein n=1 Tax=Brevibacillus laterosporus TaxID=1465 RepID=UPI002E1C637B|nr:hypothetical protein [Brevibacillus laterosporus]MED1670306.1 hypothetical protein [Brevibacillus laterosporus]MED1717899.1 hypothetical protein [Brevibacillus laterosporus]